MMDRQLSFHGDESGVIATNDDASESKRSCVKLNYYTDPYIGFLVKACERKAPEINRGYYARVKGIEICVEKFLKVISSILLTVTFFFTQFYFLIFHFRISRENKSTSTTENGRKMPNH